VKPDPDQAGAPLDADERALGMDGDITRRDFVGSAALGVGAALLQAACPAHALKPAPAGAAAGAQGASWTGYAGVGDFARSNGNTWEVVSAAHAMRDGQWSGKTGEAASTGEVYDLVVVGGGFSGIGAAYFFHKLAGRGKTCLVLDNHAVPGGEAKRNEFMVQGQRLIGPQGSNDTDLAGSDPGWRGDMWRDLGLPMEVEYGRLSPDRKQLTFAPDNYIYQLWADDFDSHGFFFDTPAPHWVRNPWGNGLRETPWNEQTRRDLMRWRKEKAKPFPGSADEMQRWLDTMTYEEFLTRERGLSPAVARYADPLLASAAGLGSDVMSAYAAYYDELPGFQGLGPSNNFLAATEKLEQVKNIHSFPGGNEAILRMLVRSLIPEAIAGGSFAEVHSGHIRFEALDRAGAPTRIRVSSTVVDVANAVHSTRKGELAAITYAVDGKLSSVKARAVVMSSASWTAKRLIGDLPADYLEAMGHFPRSPVLVVNVALTNWRFLYKLGFTACSWRGGFGFTANMRPNMYIGDYRPPLDPDKPNLFTFYVPFSELGLPLAEQGKVARARMLGTTYRDYERQIRRQMVKMFAAGGFDPGRDIAGIALNRWGHAYVNAGPGFYFARNGKPAPRDILRQPLGRVAFAHSELEGNQNWAAAVREARRAAGQVMAMA
jgi:spermidine dehydrogenase